MERRGRVRPVPDADSQLTKSHTYVHDARQARSIGLNEVTSTVRHDLTTKYA